jgi:ribosomal protein S27E
MIAIRSLKKKEMKKKIQRFDDAVLIGVYEDSDICGDGAEIEMRWVAVGSSLYPRMEMFDDSWGSLGHFRDLFDAMAQVAGQGIGMGDFCKMLEGLGYEDATEPNQADYEETLGAEVLRDVRDTEMKEVLRLMAKVNRYTRASKNGKEIYCPNCKDKTTVYHFAWSAITCQKCKKMIDKEKWNVVT